MFLSLLGTGFQVDDQISIDLCKQKIVKRVCLICNVVY